MASSPYAPQPLKGWYWAGAIAVLLFMGIGVAGYLMTVTADRASLPADQQAMLAAQPTWMIACYAIAVWSGLPGAVLLLLRRKWAVPVLLVSLIGAVGTFLPYLVVPSVRELASEGDGAAAIIVIALCWTSYWFARHSQRRGWLR